MVHLHLQVKAHPPSLNAPAGNFHDRMHRPQTFRFWKGEFKCPESGICVSFQEYCGAEGQWLKARRQWLKARRQWPKARRQWPKARCQWPKARRQWPKARRQWLKERRQWLKAGPIRKMVTFSNAFWCLLDTNFLYDHFVLLSFKKSSIKLLPHSK